MDYRPGLYGRGGIGVYTRELARALAAAFPEDHLALYAKRFRRRRRSPEADDVVPRGPGVELKDGRLPSRALPWLDRLGVGTDRILGGVDVMHWTDYTTLPTGAPVVATIHDVLFETLPACYTPDMLTGLRAVTRRIVDAAAALVVPSTRTRDGLVRHFGVPTERITVVPHGATSLPVGRPVADRGRYVLMVGTLEPRKNHIRLVAAVAKARETDPDLRLVVAGARGWLDADVVAALGAHDWVDVLGPVGPDQLGPLYAGAHVVAYPSLGEGFGLPVLEALALGRPTLVGADTACSDVAADAALAADALDVDALAEALCRLAADDALRARLERAGPARASAFTWAATARATRAVYAQAVEHQAATA